MRCHELVTNLNTLLAVEQFKDDCPNGLQIEGDNGELHKIICGVSLSQALIDVALAQHATVIIVHHGVFWHKSEYPLVGVKYQRVAKIIKNDINLLAYHLPLDNHAELGNNAQLARLLNLRVVGQTGVQNLIWYGELNNPCSLATFVAQYQQLTGHAPRCFGNSQKIIKRIAWCSGGADNLFEGAINLAVDCYLTGEAKEPIMNLALESGVAFISGGHYVSERYGIMALTTYLQGLGLDAEFVELYNPL